MAKDLINIVALVCAIAAAVVVGRTTLLKQTIAALEALVASLEKKNKDQAEEIKALKENKDDMEQRVKALEAIIRGNPQMVDQGYLAPCERCGRRNCAAHPKNPKNRHSR